VVFESRTAYKDVLYYLKNLLVQYAPLLYDEQARENIGTHVAEIGDEVAVLSVTTKDIDPLLGCITDGLEMAEGSKVEMLISPSDNRFLMRASSEYLMHHNYLATNIDVKAGNAGDSLAMSLAAADLYAGMFHFSGVELNGGAKDNAISVDAMFADSLRDLQGELSAMARISRKNNRRNLSISFNPTRIYKDDNVWDITTDGVEIDSSRIDIRNFAVRSDTQELFVNGVASRSDRDSVYMSLRNFSLAPFTQITNRLGYEINGSTNGYATVHSALKDTRIDARIEMDSVNVSGVNVPDLLLTSQWDFGRSRASLDISTRYNNKRVIRGYFAPSQMRYYARMQTEGVKMSLLDPMLRSVIRDTEGVAEVDLTLSGERRMAELRGDIKVDSLATTVDYTRCRYSVPKATIKVEDNRLLTEDVPVFDKNGREGKMSLDVSLAHLSNIEYNVGLRVNNMEVLNTTERDNPMFYGSIFATGTGSIRGDKAGIKMDFVARSDDNSKFYMPLTDNSDIQSADFVTFATKESDTTSYLVRKKMMFENRQKRRTSGSSAMDITMALDVRPNAEVQLVIDPTVGDIIKGTGEGLLNLRINPQADIFEMYGDYTIEKGSYLFTLQNVINKWFDIEPGSTIQWTGEPLDALLNIDAVYKLKASLQPLLEGSLTESNRSTRAVPVECFIHLTDRLTQPTVNFDIVVPSADSDVQNIISSALATPESKSQQFLYLIIANSFISESTNSMSSSIGASATAATGFEMLSNQFSNWLSNDDYKIVLRYRPRTEQMSDEVDFGFSKGLIDNRLLIEVEGNYIVDKTQVVNANSNFTGEAYLTWLIDRAGTLRLKGFTHTIDRFDENQGLQETGIGIYFKEDFNNARDLRYRLKNRFKREKKESKKTKTNDTKQQTK
ncbi:MAG: translocation/assembly module TamB domain-containing protein, partial [Alistipes sp.]|nr:translocation/assembly module TamB domain-containing protein [Alistipes sp.]